jgi:aspartyl-tRNA(Asn)/glutamyl-tRNA(Gln) amidotransferase subunit C
MSQSELDVAYIARLARLRLTDQEAELFGQQLAQVLDHVDKLSEVDTSGIEAAAHPVPMFNVFRDDASRGSFTADDALQNAPRAANGLFIVPKVVE